MTDAPGADERRVRQWLRRHGVGPDATPQRGSAVLTAPQPTAHPAAPAPAPAPMVGPDRLPAWRDPKPELKPTGPAADPDPTDPSADPDPEPEPDPDPTEADADPDQAERLPAKRKKAPAPVPAPPSEAIREAADEIAAGLLTDPAQRQRIAHVAYNGSAAALGHSVGLAPWLHDSLDYYGSHDTNNGVTVGVGVIVVCLLVEIKSHAWRGRGAPIILRVLGWIARVPLASAVLALALYGPDASL